MGDRELSETSDTMVSLRELNAELDKNYGLHVGVVMVEGSLNLAVLIETDRPRRRSLKAVASKGDAASG
jgi:hypothetical protein